MKLLFFHFFLKSYFDDFDDYIPTLLSWCLEHFFSPHIGKVIIPIDFHVFQRGSNHQPVLMDSGGLMMVNDD